MPETRKDAKRQCSQRPPTGGNSHSKSAGKGGTQAGGPTTDRRFESAHSSLSGAAIQPRASGANVASQSDKNASGTGAFTPQLIQRLIESLKEKL